MALTGINGFNAEFQNFARFVADKNVGQRAILRMDGSARIFAASGDFIGNIGRKSASRDANEAIRAEFLVAVEDLFGGPDKVPAKVRQAMAMEDYCEQGKPLSARRVRAVTESVTNHLASLRTEANALLEIALDRVHNEVELVEEFSGLFDNETAAKNVIKNGTPAELESLIADLRSFLPGGDPSAACKTVPRGVPQVVPQAVPEDAFPENHPFQLQLNAVPNTPGSTYNQESRVDQTTDIYDFSTGRTYNFREYAQDGGGGFHCFFLSALRHLGVKPSVKNACALREIFKEMMAEVVANMKSGNSPVVRGENSYSIDGNVISELFAKYERLSGFGKDSTAMADVSFGALLPSLLGRPVVIVCFGPGQKDAGFQTFNTDILTGESYADAGKEPVYIHFTPGHFQALELVSMKEPTAPLPKDAILNNLIPENLRNDPRGKALSAKIFNILDGNLRLPSDGRWKDIDLSNLVRSIASNPTMLAEIKAEISRLVNYMLEGQDVLDVNVLADIDGTDLSGAKIPGKTCLTSRLLDMVQQVGGVLRR